MDNPWIDRLPPWAHRLVVAGISPDATPSDRSHQATFRLLVLVIAVLCTVWVATYAALGLWMAASIPFLFQLVSAVTLPALARGASFGPVRDAQMTLMMILPFLLQWSLGGFANSSAIAIWGLIAPLMIGLVGSRPLPWTAGFAALAVFSVIIDPLLTAAGPPDSVVRAFYFLNLSGVGITVFISVQYFTTQRVRMEEELEAERDRSDELLTTILPVNVAARLKNGEDLIADRLSQATVLLADVVDFTPMSEHLDPSELVVLMDKLFTPLDDLAAELDLEKIKSVGDSYQVIGGINGHSEQADHVVEMGLRMIDHARTVEGPLGPVNLRVGIDVGPLVAGVIGTSKMSFGLWGDAVSTASRMETTGVPGRVHVTPSVAELIDGRYGLESRGVQHVKGKGEMETFLVSRLQEEPERV